MKREDDDSPVKVTYTNGLGTVTARPSYYCEADPAVAKIRRAFLDGTLTRAEATLKLIPLVGRTRFERHAAKHGVDFRAASMKAFVKWQESNPLESRLYGGVSVITAIVLAERGHRELDIDA